MSKDYIFNTPSFIHGLASIGNLTGRVHVDMANSANEADTKAITSDWNAIGKDILGAIDEYAQSI